MQSGNVEQGLLVLVKIKARQIHHFLFGKKFRFLRKKIKKLIVELLRIAMKPTNRLPFLELK